MAETPSIDPDAASGQDIGGEGGDAYADAADDGLAWTAAIDDPALRAFAEESPSLRDFAQRAFNQRQKLSTALVKPGRNATEDEIQAFRRALGVPDRVEDYRVRLPHDLPRGLQAGSQALLGEFLPLAREIGLDSKQAQQLVEWNAANARAAMERESARDRDHAEALEAEMRQEEGADYAANDALAQRALRTFAGDDFTRLLETVEVDGRKLGNHPALRRAFVAIGRTMGERTGFGDVLPGDGRLSLQDEIDQIEALQHSDIKKYKSPEIQARRRQLYARLHGQTPVAGPGVGGG